MTTLAQLIDAFDPTVPFTVDDSWLQGRTLYGGISVALALRAAELSEASGNLPPLKSAQVNFVGPASGALRFAVQKLREGKSATTLSVDLFSDEQLALRCTFIFAQPRDSSVVHDFSQTPTVPAPDALRTLPLPPGTPTFFQNFETRFAGGAFPISGAEHPELIAWLRHLDASGVEPAVALLAIADALPPSATATMKRFVPLSSMTWALDLPQPAVAGEWFLLHATSERAASGYAWERMQVWSQQGQLLLSSQQTIAIFG